MLRSGLYFRRRHQFIYDYKGGQFCLYVWATDLEMSPEMSFSCEELGVTKNLLMHHKVHEDTLRMLRIAACTYRCMTDAMRCCADAAQE